MQFEAVACNKCGAPLDVAPTTNFAVCAHCGSRLAVKRTGSTAFTEVLGQIEQHTSRMADSVDVIRCKAELDLADRELLDVQNTKLPDESLTTLLSWGIGLLLFGALLMVFGGISALVGISLVAVGVWILFTVYRVGKLYGERLAEAQRKYQRKRADITARMNPPSSGDS